MDTRKTYVELVAVRVAGQQFAIDIMSVREIRGWSVSTPLPHAPSYVRGMINLRGTVLPVIDLGARLGLNAVETSGSPVVVVVELGGNLAGLLVDEVCDLMVVDRDDVQAVPDVGSSTASEFLWGIMPMDTSIVSLLCLDRISEGAAKLAA